MITFPTRVAGFALFLVGLAASAASGQADPPAVSPAPSVAVASLEKLVSAEPDDPTLRYFLAYLKAGDGDRQGALAALRDVLRLGKGFLPTDAMFKRLASDAAFVDLRKAFATKLPRVVTGRVVATLPDTFLIPEGIAHDAAADALYVGSIARRAIYRVTPRGQLEPLSSPADGLQGVLGIAVDSRARKLYAVSTSALTDVGRSVRRNAVFQYDLAARRLERTYEIADAQQLNDVAVGDGFLLVTDSAGGGVWRIALADGRVDAVVPLGRAPGANGVAIVDATRAYVATNRRPLRVELPGGGVTPLRLPPGEQAAGIDGLYWHDGGLIGVQNVTNPARVIRLTLDAQGTSVTRLETLQSHHQRAFVEPTTAAVSKQGLYVLARTYVTRFGADGRIADTATVKRPQVLLVPWPAEAS